MQAYSNPSRESDPHALPDVEVFYMSAEDFQFAEDDTWMFERAHAENDDDEQSAETAKTLAGWYWWTCLPGCLPDSDPIGPFASEAEALADAQSMSDDDDDDETETEPR